MKFKHPIYICLSAFIAFTMASCGSSPSNKEKNAKDFNEQDQNLKDQIEGVVYNMPSPSEIPWVRFG